MPSLSDFVKELREKTGAGRFGRSVAEDEAFWRAVLLPSLLGIAGPAAGLTCLHAACVAWNFTWVRAPRNRKVRT